MSFVFKNKQKWHIIVVVGGKKALDLFLIACQEQIKENEKNKNAIDERIRKSSDERLLQMAVNHIDTYVRNTAKRELEERGNRRNLIWLKTNLILI